MGTEKRLAPLTATLCVVAAAVGVALLASAWNALGFMGWLALTASNVRYALRHSTPSVGMVPVAVASVAPAAIGTLLAGPAAGIRFWLAAAAGAVACAVAVCFLAWFWRLRSAYVPPVPLTDDPVVIVLGGAIRDGKPRQTLARRLDVVAAILHERPRATAILTGGPVASEDVTEAQAMADYLARRHIPTAQLLLEPTAANTEQNIARSAELARDHDLADRQLCVLSSDFHLWRARAIGRAQGIELAPIPAPTPRSGRLQQWCREVLTILHDHPRP